MASKVKCELKQVRVIEHTERFVGLVLRLAFEMVDNQLVLAATRIEGRCLSKPGSELEIYFRSGMRAECISF